jgi:hypothetical protein
VKVRCDEGVANRIGPEPCTGAREGAGEASVGECIGQPLSRESIKSGCRRCAISGRQHGRAHLNASARTAQRGQRPWHVHTLLVSGNREISRSTVQQKLPVRVGKVRSRSR